MAQGTDGPGDAPPGGGAPDGGAPDDGRPPARRLTRSRDRKLGGVAGGVAEYFDVDPTIVRVVFVVLLLFPPFPLVGGLVLYLILWLIMPEPGEATGNTSSPSQRAGAGMDGAVLLGGVLLVAGFLFLFQRAFAVWWPGWWVRGMMEFAWPVLLIAIGALILLAAVSRRA